MKRILYLSLILAFIMTANVKAGYFSDRLIMIEIAYRQKFNDRRYKLPINIRKQLKNLCIKTIKMERRR